MPDGRTRAATPGYAIRGHRTLGLDGVTVALDKKAHAWVSALAPIRLIDDNAEDLALTQLLLEKSQMLTGSEQPNLAPVLKTFWIVSTGRCGTRTRVGQRAEPRA